MSDSALLHARQSVFTKLVAVMLGMAVILLTLVLGFFLLYLRPTMNASIDGVVHGYVHAVARNAPDYRSAKELADRVDVQMRYEGPAGGWATSPDLPTVAEARHHGRGSFSGQHYYVTGSPDGGTYVFAWDLNKRLHTAHLVVPAVLMLLVTTVVFAAHRVLKRLLLPLQLLGEGVAGVAEGRFDVVVPKRSADEFGALTDAFNRMVTRVKDMVRARDRLLLDVSHELRSPLTRLKVALSLLEEHDVKTRMAADVAEMEMMIAELLELERLRDTQGISVAEHDLLPLLHETAESFQNRPPGVRVMSVSRELLTNIDREKVRTVVRNLLENAFKYSLPTSRPVEISAAQRADGIEVRVSDDGIGIPAEDVERVFEPFFRVDPSRSKSTGGYGLGLSICKRVMEAHGGSIAVERLAGRGTSFILTFPASALAKSA